MSKFEIMTTIMFSIHLFLELALVGAITKLSDKGVK